MSLISTRPRLWNQVVGQERVLRVLHLALHNQGYLPRGVIFEGAVGIGKTTVAYLFARALMCTGGEPLGCGKCASCLTEFGEEGVEHPDVCDVDAAVYSGVDKARELLQTALQPPAIAKRRIVVLDEAHRMSKEAWDVYLRTLEQNPKYVTFLFVTSDGAAIPESIRSRCANLRFSRLSEEHLLGVLMSRADQEGIRYTLDGLRRISGMARGSARDALQMLSLAALTGEVTPENVHAVISLDMEDLCIRTFAMVAGDRLGDAVRVVDEAVLTSGPTRFVEHMFTHYAEQMFQATPLVAQFGSLKEMNAFFLKWTSSPYLPADALPLMLMELNELRPIIAGRSRVAALPGALSQPGPTPPLRKAASERPLTSAEFMKELNLR
jgi:DNA polymerase III subunit gamma/tau